MKNINNAEDKLKIDQSYKTRVLIVRHGESVGNALRRFLGFTNLDLTDVGYLQAEKTASLLADVKIDKIYSSSLMRAYNTAVPHARLRGMEIITSDNLREIYAGEWEGMYVSDIIEKYGSVFTHGWRECFGTFTVPGGESVTDLGERICSEVKRIASENEGKTILITSHAAAIRSFWGKISGISPEDLNDAVPFPLNAAVSVVYYENGELIPGVYSYGEHLTCSD